MENWEGFFHCGICGERFKDHADKALIIKRNDEAITEDNPPVIIRVGNFESSSKKILSCSQWQTPILVTPPCTGQPRCVDSYFYIVSVLNFLWCVDFHFDIVSVLSFSDNTFKAFFFVSMEALTRQQQIISKILYFFPLKT